MQIIITLALLFCIVSIVKPIPPIKSRFVAVLGAFALFLFMGVQQGNELIKQAEIRVEQRKAMEAGTANSTDIESISAAQNPSSWSYTEEVDEMRGKSIKTACITAENTLNFSFPYGEETARLCLRKHPEYGNDVYLSVSRGQFLCNSYDGCTVNVKFSQGSVQKFSAGEPSDHDSTVIFIRNYTRFLQGVTKSDVTYIEAGFYQEGAPQMKFDTKGLDLEKLK